MGPSGVLEGVDHGGGKDDRSAGGEPGMSQAEFDLLGRATFRVRVRVRDDGFRE